MIIIIVILLVLLMGGGYWGNANYGPWGGGVGIGGILLLILILYFLGFLHR